jgi:hypothetical protein
MSDIPPSPNSPPAVPSAASREAVPHKIKIPGRTQRNMALVRRWMRDTFSKEQLLSGLRQLAWVAPLTVLIWVWAEREQQIKETNFRFAIEVTPSNPKFAVRLREPADGYVTLDLVGSRNRIEDLRREMGSRGPAPIRFEVPDRKEGEHQFSVKNVIERDPRFTAVDVTGSSPSLLSVYVDPIQEDVVTVKVREEDKALFEGVVFNPPKVRVKMPAAVRAKVKTGDEIFAYANLSSVVDRTPGRKQEISGVRVSIPGADAEEAAIEPAAVSVSLTAVERAKELLIKKVAVLQTVANKLDEGVTIKYDPLVLFDVRVSGPPEAIDKIDPAGSAAVMAQVLIENTDVDKGLMKKQVRYLLPEGVKIHPDDAKREVEVTVTSNSTGQ